MNKKNYRSLVNAFPVVFLERPVIFGEVLASTAPLTGYLHASAAGELVEEHGHYIGLKEEVTIMHSHKGGQRAHDHEAGFPKGKPEKRK